MSPEGGARAIGPGAVLGERYRLERVIATGGMATVWLARDIELDRDVAVKILSDVLAENKTYAERFRREARVAAGLSDPSLVRMFDYSGRAERPYLVMEYVAGAPSPIASPPAQRPTWMRKDLPASSSPPLRRSTKPASCIGT